MAYQVKIAYHRVFRLIFFDFRFPWNETIYSDQIRQQQSNTPPGLIVSIVTVAIGPPLCGWGSKIILIPHYIKIVN